MCNSVTFGFKRVGSNVFFGDSEEDGITVEFVELRFEERDRKGACEGGNAFAQR